MATLLTLVFLPALYEMWFRITPSDKRSDQTAHIEAISTATACAA